MAMTFNTEPWWRTDAYEDTSPTGLMPVTDSTMWGPFGPALVKLWDDGRTQTGWGRESFQSDYRRREFSMQRILFGYERRKWNFAWIMRSARIVCIDIDGKNGGFEHVSELGFLPPTLSETSKSGNGYHLFYATDDTWDHAEGFAAHRDQIGIVTGVDIRGTGCVYHYPTQGWNDRPLAQLPKHLDDRLQLRRKQQQLVSANIAKTLSLDPEEIAMMHDDLITELAKPIPAGKRNNTLFAIGSKMKEARVPEWSELLADRANEIGLDEAEVDKLIANIVKYV